MPLRWTSDAIRKSFLDFFASKGHEIVPSASLIPTHDPTLLFTNAGMVQFKDYFLGLRTPSSRRVANCQKCLRISGKHNDLEAVGRDTYHHTFFEMLGNWSFGDYYKAEAIAWHFELITTVWGIAPALVYATIFEDDGEADQAWSELNVLPAERIMRFGAKDNFWEMGETGPCGPSSEIHIDRGEAACTGSAHRGGRCGVNVEGCGRFVELANLVFIQFDRDSTGRLTPLPKRHVDTGTGLERVAAVLQGAEVGRLLGNYDIDIFQAIMRSIEEVAREYGRGVAYGRSSTTDLSFRAIADHARAIAFLIADGVLPGNAEREYVLRRLIRRAARHGRYLGIVRPFLGAVVDAVVAAMGSAYPELREKSARIGEAVSQEEERFGETLDRGLELITYERERLRAAAKRTLPGDVAFKLYDTYGFPLDLTQDVLRDDGIEVDVEGFNRLMDEQRERARAARKEESGPQIIIPSGLSSRFIGYDRYEADSELLEVSTELPDRLVLVAAETPFYPEGGGQVGDRGAIEAEDGVVLEVTETRKADGAIIHLGRVTHGDARALRQGAHIRLKVDRETRDAAMLNHSATHVLHYALRELLGKHVRQAGSLVDPAHLRFDFSHSGPIPKEALGSVEEEVNARIREDARVTSEEMSYEEAMKAGALAFFGDKYGDRVRVVRMGDFSVELCGGTHVNRTGQIGLFKLEGESGVAAGVRRIEARTGRGALESIRQREKLLEEIGEQLGVRDSGTLERLRTVLAREKELEKKLRALERKLVGQAAPETEAETITQVTGIKVVTRKVEGIEPAALREMADRLRQKHGSAVVALGSDLGDRAALLVAVTPDLTARVKAGRLIRQIAPIVGGSGGGRDDFAQAGGKEPAKLAEALERIAALIE